MSKYLPSDIRKRLRKKFPVLEKKAYLNAASIGPWPIETQKALKKFVDNWAELRDPTRYVFDYWREIRPLLADFINAPVEQIEFGFNTSHGLSIVANGIDWKEGDQIILSDLEFPANTYPWTNLRTEGVDVKFIKSRDGFFDIETFENEITPQTRMLALSFVQYFNGFRNDLERLGQICHEKNIFFLVDGIQGVGNIPLDVDKCRIDFLSCGAQKWLLSPVGTGFFYVAPQPKIPIKARVAGWFGVDWQEDWTNLMRHNLEPEKTAEKYRLSAYPFVDMFAMHQSIQLIHSVGVENIHEHNLYLGDMLIEYLQSDDFYTLKSSIGPQNRSSIISFACDNAKELFDKLTGKDILLSFREGLIRVSIHLYNSEEHIEKLIRALKKFARKK